MKPHELRRLQQIAAMKRDLELGKLEKLSAHLNRLKARAGGIQRARDERMADLSLDLSRLSGADVLWNRLGEQQIARVRSEEARLRYEREILMRRARRAYGKAAAIDDLAGKLAEKPKYGE